MGGSHKGINPMKTLPIFVGGCERSGTTLLGSMLSSHSQILYTPESNFFFDILHNPNYNYDHLPSKEVFEQIKRHPRFKALGMELNLPEWGERNEYVPYSSIIKWIISSYSSQVHRKDLSNYLLWVNHTPTNIRYASVIFVLFPEAKLIHLVRDGRAVAASLLQTSWGPKSMLDASRFWLTRVALGLGAESKFGPSRVLRIYYKDLVTSPNQTLQNIYNFTGITHEPFNESEIDVPLPAFNRISHKLVGKLLERKRISDWKNQLTPRQIEIFEYLSGDMLDYLGFKLEYGIKARPLNYFEILNSYLKKFYLLSGELITRLQLLWFRKK